MRAMAMGQIVPPSPEPVNTTPIASARFLANQCDGTATMVLKMSAEARPKRTPWHSMNW